MKYDKIRVTSTTLPKILNFPHIIVIQKSLSKQIKQEYIYHSVDIIIIHAQRYKTYTMELENSYLYFKIICGIDLTKSSTY